MSSDDASSESALIHALKVLKEKDGYSPDLLCFMQCTSPLTAAEDIDNAIHKLIKENADTCFTAKSFHYFIWQEDDNGMLMGINHDKNYRKRRQDIVPQYEENGAIYVMNVTGFIAAEHRFFGKTVVSLMPPERCMEIDNSIDLVVGEALLCHLRKKVLLNKSENLKLINLKSRQIQLHTRRTSTGLSWISSKNGCFSSSTMCRHNQLNTL